jgi:hypothetical protein
VPRRTASPSRAKAVAFLRNPRLLILRIPHIPSIYKPALDGNAELPCRGWRSLTKDHEVCVQDQTAARLILHHLLVKQTGLPAHISPGTHTLPLSERPPGVDIPP